jgi:hypothetical protein
MLRLTRTAVAILVALAMPAWGLAPANAGAAAPASASEDPNAAEIEKKAFDAAKELDTAEEWKAFLAKHPNGFYADLARVYQSLLEVRPASSPETDVPTGAAANAAPVTGVTVARVRYEGGELVKGRGKVWTEQRPGKPALRFVETSRTEDAVLLYDASRKVTLTIGIKERTILIAVGRRAPEKLYDITEALAASASAAAAVEEGAGAAAVKSVVTPGRECAEGYTYFKGRCRKLAGTAKLKDCPPGTAAGTANCRPEAGGQSDAAAAPVAKPAACRKWLTQCGQRNYASCDKYQDNCH